MIIGARVLSSCRRYRRGRLAAVTAAVLVGLAVPLAAPSAAAGQGTAGQAAANCPWVLSRAPIAQRVAQLMGQMSLADEITMVEGHGTTNPYVFYTPAIPALCIPAVGLEDGPAGVADGEHRPGSALGMEGGASRADDVQPRRSGRRPGRHVLGHPAALRAERQRRHPRDRHDR